MKPKKKIVEIISASYFRQNLKVVESFKEKPVQKSDEKHKYPEKSDTKDTVAEAQSPVKSADKEPAKTKTVTGLSLKGLRKKKEEILEQNMLAQGQTLPTEDFTQEDFDKYWSEYLEKLRKNHERNLLSILTIDSYPRVIDHKIHLTLTSEALKKELERTKEKVLKFLRSNLHNYDIDFVIEVKEEKKKEFIYSNKDKLRKLMEKYPDLVYLKDKFKFDI